MTTALGGGSSIHACRRQSIPQTGKGLWVGLWNSVGAWVTVCLTNWKEEREGTESGRAEVGRPPSPELAWPKKRTGNRSRKGLGDSPTVPISLRSF